ncbi:Cof-type HAD-IIB family hydrolase [Streptococcus himalayensis]|uniref:Haloacid dehalogenase n=1 Tax=Streptococcus himalayensis TaxID=1888195 RepID=A0A917ACE8_9STRE|nr:Cof-type HAD-IIB family hydrolase [Streptococcus himalayensis]GGE38162.1 haloacid dehalogenase [Streptococcus himalayensis]
MIQLIALDMDGTLLDEAKEIPQANIDAIHQALEKGVKLVLCTGRPLIGVKPYFEKLGLDSENEYVIVNNGCSTHQTSDWSLVDFEALTADDIRYLASLTKDRAVQFTLFDEEHYFVVDEKPSEIVRQDASLVFTQPTEISLAEATSGKHTLFEGMFLAEKEILDQFEKDYATILAGRFNGVRSQPTIYETLPKATSKASALARLAANLQIEPATIMALGDANNDIEMLEFAGLGIAMGNASDTVKSIADAVTGSNEENGVATAIQRYILKENL